MAQQRRQNFLPLPAAPSFLARQESPSFAVEPLRGAPSFASGPSITIEAAMVRARKQRSRRTTMATIGTSRRPARTNSPAKSSPSRSRPRTSGSSPKPPAPATTAPATALVGRVEIGAAWAKRSNEGRDYLGLKLDDRAHRPDLRQPLRRRGRRGLQPDLVPPQRPPERLTRLQCPVRLVRRGIASISFNGVHACD